MIFEYKNYEHVGKRYLVELKVEWEWDWYKNVKGPIILYIIPESKVDELEEIGKRIFKYPVSGKSKVDVLTAFIKEFKDIIDSKVNEFISDLEKEEIN